MSYTHLEDTALETSLHDLARRIASSNGSLLDAMTWDEIKNSVSPDGNRTQITFSRAPVAVPNRSYAMAKSTAGMLDAMGHYLVAGGSARRALEVPRNDGDDILVVAAEEGGSWGLNDSDGEPREVDYTSGLFSHPRVRHVDAGVVLTAEMIEGAPPDAVVFVHGRMKGLLPDRLGGREVRLALGLAIDQALVFVPGEVTLRFLRPFTYQEVTKAGEEPTHDVISCEWLCDIQEGATVLAIRNLGVAA